VVQVGHLYLDGLASQTRQRPCSFAWASSSRLLLFACILLLGLYRLDLKNLAFSRFFFKAKVIDFLHFSAWCIDCSPRDKTGNRDGAHFKGQEGTYAGDPNCFPISISSIRFN
jgi:hypothetical protein